MTPACLKAVFCACVLALAPVSATAFEVSFSWDDLDACTTGTPVAVKNPLFTLTGVPPGTRFLRFRLADLDAPKVKHGGGIVRNDNLGRIKPGAFTYLRPCPAKGSHRYVWTVTALKGKKVTSASEPVGETEIRRKYP